MTRELDPLWQRLRIELAGEGVSWADPSLDATDERAPGAQSDTEISLMLASCREPREITVTVARRGIVSRSRVVSLSEAASANGARSAALVIAELVRVEMQTPTEPAASGADSESPANTEQDRPQRPQTTEAAAVPPTSADELGSSKTFSRIAERVGRDPRATIGAEFVQRTYLAHGTTLFGARVSSTHPLAEQWDVRAAANMGWGRQRDVIGAGSVWTTTAIVGVTLILPSSPVRLEAGPEFELGYARVRGQPGDSATLGSAASGLIAVAGMHARVTAPLSPSWWWFVTAEAGLTVQGIAWKADARWLGGIDGATFATAVGAALTL